MQDFALRSAQAQIEDLQRQLSWQRPSSERGSGSFLGGLGSSGQQYPPRSESGSVPSVNPWARSPSGEYPPPPPEPGYPGYAPSGPVMQPSQTSGFLRNAATTAAGVAGGALLFQGINSLFSGHHGGLLGGDLSSLKPTDSLSAATAVRSHRGDTALGQDSDRDADYGGDSDADYGDDGDDADFG